MKIKHKAMDKVCIYFQCRSFKGGRSEMKRLPEHAVYSDVVNNNLILPQKRKYTIRDFRKLLMEGWSQIDARWIVLCSAVYWNAEPNKKLESADFLKLCQCGIAHL